MQGISEKASKAIEAASYNHDRKWWVSTETPEAGIERGAFGYNNLLLSGDYALKGGTGRRLFYVDVATGRAYVPEVLHQSTAA
ncbi:hypothetical protein [Paenarthrobacter sp. TA1.8]|uniref:hypothetical protein n=1 Tax=Paenarthrobacter sp. TA1.8 TaxID=3400219 RepID=UPI003B434E0D